MEISDVDTVPVRVPVKTRDRAYGIAPYVSGTRLHDLPETLDFEEALAANETATEAAEKLLVRVRTEGGVTGYGEINVPSYDVGEAMFRDVIAPELVGRRVSEMEAFAASFETFPSSYYRDIGPYVGAAEMAMWDALGKHLEEPLYALIGGKRAESVPVTYLLGLLTPEESREYAQFAHDAGFEVLKTKGSRYWRADVERATAIHEAGDGDLDIRVDPNQLWSLEEAVRVGAALEDRGVYLECFEQPIRIDGYGALKRLRERLRTPIAVNEDAYFPRSLLHLAREDAVDAAVVDVVPSGGITGLRRLAGVADDMGISLAHHSNFDLGVKNAAKVHLWATTPACELAIDSIYYAMEEYLYEDPMTFEDGRIQVPDNPGLNGRIDEDALERHRLD